MHNQQHCPRNGKNRNNQRQKHTTQFSCHCSSLCCRPPKSARSTDEAKSWVQDWVGELPGNCLGCRSKTELKLIRPCKNFQTIRHSSVDVQSSPPPQRGTLRN